MRCDEIMKSRPECLEPGATIRDAATKMRDHNVGFLPVCDQDRVLGVITDRDLVVRCLADDHGADEPVHQVMTTQIVACRPDDDVRRAEQLMGQAQKSRILVTDAQGRLVGVISLSDIAQVDDDAESVARTMREVTDRETRSH